MTLDLGERFCRWAARDSSVTALVEIGSRVRTPGHVAMADELSDWDFQVITPRPEIFASKEWVATSGLPLPLIYVFRIGRLGSAAKVTLLFQEGELDLVVIPARRLGLARFLVTLGLAPAIAGVRRGLGELGMVLRDGYQLRKGGANWARFFARVAEQFAPGPAASAELIVLADGFVCDYVSTRRKIARGELLAAQRWLHHQLVETNFRLLHELRRRQGEATYPDARRIERLAPERVSMLAVEAHGENESLETAVQKAAAALRGLMHELVGDAWRWPDGID